MATNRRFGRRVPEWVRREEAAGVRIDSGPFIGYVKNNFDSIRSGRLQVWIPELGGIETEPANWRTVSYASPFAGTTYRAPTDEGQNNQFDQVAHSYGMWAVPPDIDCQVICAFIAGDPNRGYWFACVNSDLSHYMVPGLASGVTDTSMSSEKIKSSVVKGESNLPVVEFNEKNLASNSPGFIKNPKPVHEVQAAVLINQGLDRDVVRGAISSSSQRESPSTVFGISTPGRPLNDPADNPEFQAKMLAGKLTAEDVKVKARKGGHSFVMDDGDQTGASQLIRLRTAGGHQILMNDSEEVVYIANSNGTAWFEFTGGGHVNMYSQGGINMRTEGAFNLHADGDINLNSKANVNIRAGAGLNQQAQSISSKAATTAIQAGKITVLSSGQLALQAAAGSIKTAGDFEVRGNKILLNSTEPADVSSVPDLTTYRHSDTSADSTSNRWVSTPGVFDSIATVAPAHEPWARVATRGAKNLFDLTEAGQKKSTICEPQSLAPRKLTKVSAAGLTNEQLVEKTLRNYGITDNAQLAAIMAQCAHESGGFKYMRMLVPDSYYVRYEGRADLGNIQPGDGLKYRERGFIQITGRDIYTKAASALGLDLVNTPNIAEDPEVAAQLVVYFFFDYKKSRTSTVNWSDVRAVTRIVNGGENGLQQRRELFAKYLQKYSVGSTMTVQQVEVDSAGKPVVNATNTVNAGPVRARGLAVVNPVPISKLLDNESIIPAAVGPKAPAAGLTESQVKALMVQLGYAETFLNYSLVDSLHDLVGNYGSSLDLLKAYGYVSATATDTTLGWTGKDGIKSRADWLSNPGVQDKAMLVIVQDIYAALVAQQVLAAGDDICSVAGMIAVAYSFRGKGIDSAVASAKEWKQFGTLANGLGVAGTVPYNQGRYAIDVLSEQATEAANPVSPDVEIGDSGITPSDVLTFTNNTGSYASYMRMGPAIRNAMESMAQEYKLLTGEKITINSAYRSLEDQTRIYQAWLAAGGNKATKPAAGGYYMPAVPNANAPHVRGLAFDLPKATILKLISYGLLSKYNFSYPFPVADPVHIEFKV